MSYSIDKIKALLARAPHFTISSELNDKTMSAVRNDAQEKAFLQEIQTAPLKNEDHFVEKTISPLNSLTFIIMQTFKRLVVAAFVLALMFGGFWYYGHTSYTFHLNKAKVALTSLQALLEGRPNPYAFIPSALAEETEPTVNETEVAQLSDLVVEETEKAIEATETKTDPVVVQTALAEISAVQEQAAPVLAQAVDVVTSDQAIEIVAAALETTTTDQAVVEQAKTFVDEAVTKGEKTVAIDVETKKDRMRSKKAQKEELSDTEKSAEARSQLEKATAELEKLKATGLTEEALNKFQSKLDRVNAAFEEGKWGRVHGLSTAIAAQSKHIFRKAEKGDVKKNVGKKEKRPEVDKEYDKGVNEDENDDGLVDEQDQENESGDRDDEGGDDEGENDDRATRSEFQRKPMIPQAPEFRSENQFPSFR